MKQRPAAFYVPTKLRLETFPPHLRDYIAYFLNLLHWSWIMWKGDDDGFVPLKHEYITRIIPRADWLEVRKWLVGKQVIHADNNYQPGSRSQRYRLAPQYRKTRRVVCQDEKLNRKIHRVYSEDARKLLPVHRWLRSMSDRVSIDLDAAGRIIGGLRPDADSTVSVKEYRVLLEGQVQRIADGEFFLTVDDYGRVHTPVTNLAKDLRAALRIDGETPINLDLRNSQPLILGICAREYYRSRKARHSLLARSFDQRSKPYRYRRSITGCRRSSIPGVEEYVGLCEQGRLYERMMEDGEERPRFKQRFFQEVFFGKATTRSRLRHRFESTFPEVATVLRGLKQHDYCRSAWVMQNAEATIFLDIIGNRIRQEHPDLPLLTIHDSYLIHPNDAATVERIIVEEFTALDITPSLEKETYE